jgi:transposase
LYQVAAPLARFGGELSRNTQAASVVRLSKAVQPIINLLRDHLLDIDHVYGDETVVQVLKEPGRPAQTKSCLWEQMNGIGPPVRLFSHAPTSGTAHALSLYAGSKLRAVLMTDGYEPYNEVACIHHLVHLGCWTHARRDLVEAGQAIPKLNRAEHPVTGFLLRIGKLFAIEAKAQDAGMTPTERQGLREELSRPLLAEIEDLLLRHLHTVLPQSLFGKARLYVHGQWPKLLRCFADGARPISNNACENAIRRFVVGRRNWLFSDTVGGGAGSANLQSLLGTAKANGLDTYLNLVALFKALLYAKTVHDYEALLPWRLTPAAGSQYRKPHPARVPLTDRLR